MNLPIYVVDAFSEGLFTGNPAAVILLTDWLPDVQMQKIAQENNQAETAFLMPMQDVWHIRWFTPTMEVNLCGHATLASAHVLVHHLGNQVDKIRFWSRSGWLSVEIKDGLYTLDLPADELTPYDPPPFMFEAIGMDVVEFLKGREDFLAVVQDADRLREIHPDYGLISRLRARGLIVTAQDTQYDFISRCFFPQTGIKEDPATGSGHATLTQYWSKKTGKTSFRAYQASTRGARINCRIDGERVFLEGQAITYLIGEIRVQ